MSDGQSEAKGRELPVKDLWRWVKQMFKTWQHQENVEELKARLHESEKFKERVHKALDISDENQLEAILNGISMAAQTDDKELSPNGKSKDTEEEIPEVEERKEETSGNPSQQESIG